MSGFSGGGFLPSLQDVPWQTFVPSFSWGSPGSGAASFTINNARYKQIGKTVFFTIDVTMTAVGTGTSAGLVYGLPVNLGQPSGINALIIGSGRETATLGKLLGVADNSTTTGYLTFYDSASPVTAGAGGRFKFGGCYEAA